MKPKISHEVPIELFKYHNLINDYPYLLAHLLSPKFDSYNKEYADFYKETVKQYDYSILDNGAFELGDSITSEILHEIGEEYKPTHIILPDKLHDTEETRRRCIEYVYKYSQCSSPKFMAVLQGNTLDELFKLFKFYSSFPEIDMIALPFDILPNNSQGFEECDPKLLRVEVLTQLLYHNDRQNSKKLHLLGCASPNEFSYYSSREFYNYFYSLDTSAPIIYGWNHIEFQERQNELVPPDFIKPKDKLAENLNIKLDEDQLITIASNIRRFRRSLNS